MKLSVIIVSYNTEKLLEKCLTSLGSNIETEIIVIDNASADSSRELVKRNFPKAKLICNSENLGFAKAVNKGIKVSVGESILLLNSDTRIKNKAIDNLLSFEEKVSPAIIGPKLINPDGTIQPSAFRLPTVLGAIREYWLNKKNTFSKYIPESDQPQPVEAVSGGAMLLSREVIQKIGLLDEKYFFYFEDLDYCRRAGKAGIKTYYLPSAEIIHEHGASGKDLANQENQWRRLIPSSKIYHGLLRHWLITAIIKIGQIK